MRFGIPDFKLDKKVIDRRLEQMVAEGLTVKTGINIGVDMPVAKLQEDFDATVLTGGSEKPRDLPITGRDVSGIHFAMDFLAQQNHRVFGTDIPAADEILANDKHVVVIGGGDTGSDCVGTSIRHGAKSVTQIELLPKPPKERSTETPWPLWPQQLRTSTSHQEGCERMWNILSKSFESENGKVTELNCVRLRWSEQESGRPQMEEIAGSEFTLKADLVLLAMGFLHPEKSGLLSELGVELDPRGNVQVNQLNMTSIEGVFAAGDMAIGQSLVLKAIAGGRDAATNVDKWLQGSDAVLV